jgi:hypothetical protein
MYRWLALLCGTFLVACGADAASVETRISPSAPTQTALVGRVVVSVKGAKPGEQASATVSGPPHALCTIVYQTPDGKIPRAAGLEPKTTDGQGRAIWSWPIAATTATGIGEIRVMCDGIRAEPVRIFIG